MHCLQGIEYGINWSYQTLEYIFNSKSTLDEERKKENEQRKKEGEEGGKKERKKEEGRQGENEQKNERTNEWQTAKLRYFAQGKFPFMTSDRVHVACMSESWLPPVSSLYCCIFADSFVLSAVILLRRRVRCFEESE